MDPRHAALLDAFGTAARTGAVDALTRMLTHEGWTDDLEVRPAIVNDLPALLLVRHGQSVQTTAFQLEGESIAAIDVVRNQDKLHRVLTR